MDSLHPIVSSFASSLVKSKPSFSVPARNLRILTEPTQFYAHLLDMIRRAQRRIFISSLYVGSARMELIDALQTALTTHPSLHVYFVLDLNRSTRPGPSSTADILLPLLHKHPERVHVSLFRTPKLSGLLSHFVPPRFNEGWGTWHAKIYGADDDVMISGANLNQSYFTNRQDRYICFDQQPALAQYCLTFLQTIASFSFRMIPSSSQSQAYQLEWPCPEISPYHIHRKAHEALSALQLPRSPAHTDISQEEVLIVPVIQAGQFDIHEEEDHLSQMFRCINAYQSSGGARPSIDLTSGYFGLYKAYQDLILNSQVDCRIVAASPKANGFYGSKGISGLIPEGYTLLEQRFMKAVRAAGRTWGPDGGVQLSEWEREGWTYHAKGIWLSPTPTSPPVLTLFGSTNLNSRSAHLDTELSFFLITASDTVRTRLQEEVDGLRSSASQWKGGERRVGWRTRFAVRFVDGML